jgi:hypothetical protein
MDEPFFEILTAKSYTMKNLLILAFLPIFCKTPQNKIEIKLSAGLVISKHDRLIVGVVISQEIENLSSQNIFTFQPTLFFYNSKINFLKEINSVGEINEKTSLDLFQIKSFYDSSKLLKEILDTTYHLNEFWNSNNPLSNTEIIEDSLVNWLIDNNKEIYLNDSFRKFILKDLYVFVRAKEKVVKHYYLSLNPTYEYSNDQFIIRSYHPFENLDSHKISKKVEARLEAGSIPSEFMGYKFFTGTIGADSMIFRKFVVDSFLIFQK